MTRTKVIAGILVGVAVCHGACARAATTSSFMNQPLSTRELGLGCASPGGGDLLQVWGNPALLSGRERQGEIEMCGVSTDGGANHLGGFGVAWVVSPKAVLGAFAMSRSLRVDEVDVFGDTTGTSLGVDGFVGGVAGAVQAGRIKVGMLLKVATETVVDIRSGSLAVDVGARSEWPAVAVGVSLRNAGLSLLRDGAESFASNLPLEARVGCTGRLAGFACTGEYTARPQGHPSAGVGVEYWPARMLGLRCGIRGVRAGERALSLGMSAAVGHWGLDYAAGLPAFGVSHAVSLSWRFGPSVEWLAAQAARWSPRWSIAVANLVPQGVSASEAMIASDWLRGAFVGAHVDSVVERNNMESILREQAFQQTGCTSEDCAVRLGRLLSVQRMVVGNFGIFAGSYVVNVSVINVETGQVVCTDSVMLGKESSKDDLVQAIRDMVTRISRRMN